MTLPNSPRVILASASPRRAHLMREFGWTFEVHSSDAEELEDPQFSATELAVLNAKRKARRISDRFPEALVIGADTLVFCDHHVLGKPRDMAEAVVMVQTLQGRTHQVVTGVCLSWLGAGAERSFYELTQVTFKPLTREQINEYFAAVHPLDKAGAYAIQENGDLIVGEVKGSYTNVVGLPMERLKEEFDQVVRAAAKSISNP